MSEEADQLPVNPPTPTLEITSPKLLSFITELTPAGSTMYLLTMRWQLTRDPAVRSHKWHRGWHGTEGMLSCASSLPHQQKESCY